MPVKSMFEFKYPVPHAVEGIALARSIGANMTAKACYLDHEIIVDVSDSGHIMVNTHWDSQDAAEAALNSYQHNDKIGQVTKLIRAVPTGFVGAVER